MNNPDNHQSHFIQGDEDDLEVKHMTCASMREKDGELVSLDGLHQ